MLGGGGTEAHSQCMKCPFESLSLAALAGERQFELESCNALAGTKRLTCIIAPKMKDNCFQFSVPRVEGNALSMNLTLSNYNSYGKLLYSFLKGHFETERNCKWEILIAFGSVDGSLQASTLNLGAEFESPA